MDNDIDSRALRVITDWNSREYKNEGQKAARLQVLIIAALKEQSQVAGDVGRLRADCDRLRAELDEANGVIR